MSKIFIVMGQGVCGDLGIVSFCTATLYTCSAIGMYNQNTGRGGLFHYPCNALTDPDEPSYKETEDSLKQMLGCIKPTRIGIITADAGGFVGHGTPQRDKDAMLNWFQRWNFPANLVGEGAWAGISRAGLCSTTRDVNWPAGNNIYDYQNTEAGVHLQSGTNITLVGKSGEEVDVDIVG